MVDKYHNGGNCCPGPIGATGLMGPVGPQGMQGIQGLTGPQGAQGVAGTNGANGTNGTNGIDGAQGIKGDAGQPGQTGAQGIPGQAGPQGIPGPAGAMGIQGIQGIPGTCIECPCSCDYEYAEVYSLVSQILNPSTGANLPGQPVLFEKSVVATANIDVSAAASSGAIKVNKAGWYRINMSASASLTPVASPPNVWSMALFVNGAVVPQSCFANMTVLATQEANQASSSALVHFNMGDLLTLNNTSIATIDINSIILGSNVTPVSAELDIVLLKAD